MSVFILVFCVSGIILNHRALFSGCDVSRSLLPASYQIDGWNNGIVRGTVATAPDSVIAYGGAGAWRTNREATDWADFNAGLPDGADQRAIRNLVLDKAGTPWCVTNYAVYRHDGTCWTPIATPHADERLNDLTLDADSSHIVALSRSRLYIINPNNPTEVGVKTLLPARDYSPRETLFRTVWKLHSGELFGIVGRLVVDAIAVVLIFLSITGIVLFICPPLIKRLRRRGKKERAQSVSKSFVWNNRWHLKIGALTIVLTLFVTITGTCLRPPFMIPFVLVKTAPVNFEADNVWHDRLRSIRWDPVADAWLLYTSDGFMHVDCDMASAPEMVDRQVAPLISPMGVNVLEFQSDSTWLVGSFSGLYRWDEKSGVNYDYATGEPALRGSGMGFSLGSGVVTGFSRDFSTAQPVVFEYQKAADDMPAMPELLSSQPMALWNVALELHVGRCYSPFLGPLSDMFVFIFGTLFVLIVVSGYVVYRRSHRKKKANQTPSGSINQQQ